MDPVLGEDVPQAGAFPLVTDLVLAPSLVVKCLCVHPVDIADRRVGLAPRVRVHPLAPAPRSHLLRYGLLVLLIPPTDPPLLVVEVETVLAHVTLVHAGVANGLGCLGHVGDVVLVVEVPFAALAVTSAAAFMAPHLAVVVNVPVFLLVCGDVADGTLLAAVHVEPVVHEVLQRLREVSAALYDEFLVLVQIPVPHRPWAVRVRRAGTLGARLRDGLRDGLREVVRHVVARELLVLVGRKAVNLLAVVDCEEQLVPRTTPITDQGRIGHAHYTTSLSS